jgi:Colicin E5 ribonuclease domain
MAQAASAAVKVAAVAVAAVAGAAVGQALAVPAETPAAPDAGPTTDADNSTSPVARPKPDTDNLDAHARKSMAKRGWTEEEIQEAAETGEAHPAVDKTAGDTPATRYVHPVTGKSVVVNNQTGRVIHVGGEGFKYDGPR